MTHSDDTAGGASGVPGILTSDSLADYYRERTANLRRRLPAAAAQLRSAGVTHVQFQYDGCGDSGQIESVTYTDAHGSAINPSDKVDIPQDLLMDLFYDLTEVRHPGWENGDGAYGEYEWDLVADALVHTHNARFTDYDTTVQEGI